MNEALLERIVNLIRGGNYIDVACRVCGIDQSNFNKFCKLNPEFRAAIEKAVGEAQARDVQMLDRFAQGCAERRDAEGNIIVHAMKPNLTALMFRLERRYPRYWGRMDRLETTDRTPDDSDAALTTEQRRDRIAQLQRELLGED